MSTNWGPRYSYMWETCLNPQTLLNVSFCSPSFIPIFLCPVSPPLYPLRSPLPFKSLQMFFYLSAGDHQLSPTLLYSSPLALGLFLSLERAAASGEVGNQPGDSHSECFLAAFTCTVTEKTDSLCYMQISYAHACTRSLSRQVITCRREWGFISVPVEDGSEHPWALEGFNNSS